MPVYDRGREVTAIQERLAAARAGHGGVVTIEAAAGLGKTRLLTHASERAGADGFTTLSARGSELERQFAFGVVRQLYEPLLDAGDRESLLAPATDAVDPVFAVAHGAYWLVAERAAEQPVLVAVDDAQWSDPESLRTLAYLARRVHDLPLLLVLAVRTGEPAAPDDLLSAISAEPATVCLTPGPLSRASTGELIAERMGATPDPAFTTAAHELTGGNPFLVTSLAADLRSDGVTPDAEGARTLPAATPDAVSRAVLTRLSRLGPDAAALARATAVLGDDAPIAAVAELADLSPAEAADAADRLAGADILAGTATPAFAHPLVREIVVAGIPANGRALMHARAARLLDRTGAASERVAAQLLYAPPAADPWTASRLTSAGERALERGALSGALAFLRRALEEPPPADEHARVLHALGGTEVRLGEPGGYEHLDEASEAATDVAQRAAIDFDRARGLLLAGSPEAVAALARVHDAMPPGERGDTIRKESELIALGRMSPATAPLVQARAEALAPVAQNDEPGWEAVLGALAGNAYLANGPADRVADLARRSLEGRRARGDDPAESAGYLDSCYVLMLAGALDEAAGHLDHAIDCSRRANSLIGFAAASSFRAAVALRAGDLTRAEADGRTALDAAAALSLAPLPLPATVGVLVEVLIERGEIDEADRLVREQGFDGPLPPLGPINDLAAARGHLWLEQGRATEALDELRRAGAAAQALGIDAPGPFAWRPLAALAAHAADRDDDARELANDGVRVAVAFGAPWDLGIALRASGLIAGGADGIALLEQAVDRLSGSPALLELARTRTELGAALRRSGHRPQARELLRDGLDRAALSGATVLAERARSELVTAGARPRRERTSGIDSLTASERRVAELAADGSTNRQIAEALFVSVGTVETHLTSAYAKLAIRGRRQLAGALRSRLTDA